MFTIGELVVYSKHGLCRIDDICEKTYIGNTASYYVLRPENDPQLMINVPVDNSNSLILKLITKEDAQKIFDSFPSEGIDWIDKPQLRNKSFRAIVTGGNRVEVAKVATTLMKKKHEVAADGKTLSDFDNGHLDIIQNVLFKELALALDTTAEELNEQIYGKVNKCL